MRNQIWIKLTVIILILLMMGWIGVSVFLPPMMTKRVGSCVAREWLTPLNTGKRSDWKSLLLFRKGGFLAERAAYAHLQSHVHTGIDLQNRKGGGPGEPVYAAAKGKVFNVALQAQGTRVTIQHLLANGEVVYTSYIHVAGVLVKKGQWVDNRTVIARRFNRDELKKYGSFYNHLHFQVHKNKFIPEYTVQTKTISEAQERFYDPEFIFHSHHGDEPAEWKAWLKDKKMTFWHLVSILW